MDSGVRMTATLDEQILGPVDPVAARTGGRRRWLHTVIHLGVVTVFVFLLATVLTFSLGIISKVSPAAIVAGDDATEEMVRAIEQEWGLDRPLLVQYFDWLGGLLTGDFGNSWRNGQPVFQQLLDTAPISLSVALFAMVIGTTVGFGLGILAALRQGRITDRVITVLSSAWTAIPAFVVGVLLISIFAVKFGWFPSGGYFPLNQDVGRWLWTITLPAIALSLETIGDLARQVRAGLVGTLEGNYVTGAILRGFSKKRVIGVHALRNGVGPALSILGLKFPTVLGGAIITESVFSMAGYGVFTAKAATGGDLPVVQGALIVAVVLVLIFNTLVNIALNKFSPDRRTAI
jgi:peptide/nickel transport system permease protein